MTIDVDTANRIASLSSALVPVLRGKSCDILLTGRTATTFDPKHVIYVAAPSTGKRLPPAERECRAKDLAKADIDAEAEIHLRECPVSERLGVF